MVREGSHRGSKIQRLARVRRASGKASRCIFFGAAEAAPYKPLDEMRQCWAARGLGGAVDSGKDQLLRLLAGRFLGRASTKPPTLLKNAEWGTLRGDLFLWQEVMNVGEILRLLHLMTANGG
jgi:hypothetical protein